MLVQQENIFLVYKYLKYLQGYQRINFLFIRQLAGYDGGKHQAAAAQLGGGKRLAQNQPTGQGAEHTLQAHSQTGNGGVQRFLAHNLQCVGHAAGHDAAVGNGHRRQAELLDGGLFKNQHKHGGNDRHRQKLHKAQLDTVQLGTEVVHQQNLGGKQKGTAQQLPFAAGQGQAVVPGQAQQIQAHHAGGHAAP